MCRRLLFTVFVQAYRSRTKWSFEPDLHITPSVEIPSLYSSRKVPNSFKTPGRHVTPKQLVWQNNAHLIVFREMRNNQDTLRIVRVSRTRLLLIAHEDSTPTVTILALKSSQRQIPGNWRKPTFSSCQQPE